MLTHGQPRLPAPDDERVYRFNCHCRLRNPRIDAALCTIAKKKASGQPQAWRATRARVIGDEAIDVAGWIGKRTSHLFDRD
jgi:hypothetical protein